METKSKDIVIDKKLFDITYPLMDKFKEICPGTFKHSQNVANMCETVAVDLGLNIDLLKCASIYHDIGKMNNPLYFSENQDGINIHDELDPQMSYQIITRHVGDSIIHLLQIPDLPRDVIDIVSQHHGDTVLQAFYNKDKKSPEDKYRYRCPKPVSAEALILMLCDSIEATTRSMYNNGDGNDDFIIKAVEGTILRLMDDEQLDNMKIGILNKTKKILIKELESIYHKRVAYEDDSKTVAKTRKEETL